MQSFTGIIPAPHSSNILVKIMHDSLRLFGAFAVFAYLIIYKATNLAVIKSVKDINISFIVVENLTSPILSHKNGA